MSVSEKLTTIDNSFKNIKSAILEKGASVSGDVTTYADAINSIPVGVDLVFGTITGVSGAASITIPEAIGKNNICLFYTQTTTSQYSGNGIITLLIISGQIYATYKSSGYTYKVSDTITFDSSTGTLTTNGSSGARKFNSGSTNGQYSWFAW